MEISFKHGNHVTILTIVKLLGKGAFGDVHLALDERGREFAIKKVKCNDINSYYNIAQELEMLTNLNNPNIIKMYSVDFIENNSVFIMEYCPDGSLNDRLDSSVPEFTQYMWMGQLTNALTYLHSEKIVHRDLKPENVLLKGEDTKLADFGMARKFYGMSQGRQIHDSNEYLSEYLDQMGTFAGTPYWVAPEVFDRCYNEKADIFSLGVIFYAIVTRDSFDFEDKTYYGAFTTHYRNRVGIGLAMFEQEHQIELDFKNKDDTKCNNNIIQMIRNMLRYDADKRPSAKYCLKKLEELEIDSIDFWEKSNIEIISSDDRYATLTKDGTYQGHKTRTKNHLQKDTLSKRIVSVEDKMLSEDNKNAESQTPDKQQKIKRKKHSSNRKSIKIVSDIDKKLTRDDSDAEMRRSRENIRYNQPNKRTTRHIITGPAKRKTFKSYDERVGYENKLHNNQAMQNKSNSAYEIGTKQADVIINYDNPSPNEDLKRNERQESKQKRRYRNRCPLQIDAKINESLKRDNSSQHKLAYSNKKDFNNYQHQTILSVIPKGSKHQNVISPLNTYDPPCLSKRNDHLETQNFSKVHIRPSPSYYPSNRQTVSTSAFSSSAPCTKKKNLKKRITKMFVCCVIKQSNVLEEGPSIYLETKESDWL